MNARALGHLDETPTPAPVPLMELTPWHERFGVVAGITGRAGEFNLGLATAEPAARVTDRWSAFRSAHRPSFAAFTLGLQVHGARVATYLDEFAGWTVRDGIDGHATQQPGVLLTATVADCVPVYLLHPGSGTMALLHAGWRGAAAGILERGLETVVELAQTASVSEVVMHCGVSICGDCYQVGPEVVRAVTGRDVVGPEHVDLRAVLVEQAGSLGVVEATISGWCTAHDGDRFFSHRRSGGADGRMAAYLGRPRDA